MRAPARLIAISIVVLLTLTLLLSRPSARSQVQQTFTTRYAQIREDIQQQWFAAKSVSSAKSSTSLQETPLDKDIPYEGPDAHSGTLFSSGSSSSSSSSSSKDASSKNVLPPADSVEDTASTWGKNSGSGSFSDGHVPTDAERNRDADRGFTDKEQAQALERLEYKYGAEAQGDKDEAGHAKLLWQLPTSTTEAWDTPTDIMDPEQAKAMEKLELEYETGQPTGKPKGAPADGSEPLEVGWRTTGFKTTARPTGANNGTAAATKAKGGNAVAGAFANAQKKGGVAAAAAAAITSARDADSSRFLAHPTSTPTATTTTDAAANGPPAAVSEARGNRLPVRGKEAAVERRKRFLSKKWYMQCKEFQDC